MLFRSKNATAAELKIEIAMKRTFDPATNIIAKVTAKSKIVVPKSGCSINKKDKTRRTSMFGKIPEKKFVTSEDSLLKFFARNRTRLIFASSAGCI